jgi:hydroxypyruvate isomerase
MNRRGFLKSAAAAGAVSVINPAVGAPAQRRFKLRYAPMLRWLSKEWSIEQRLAFIAEWGFDAAEDLNMSRLPLPEVEAYRKLLDKYGLDHGDFGGGGASPQNENFAEELKKVIPYHEILRNKTVLVTSGQFKEKEDRAKQVQFLIDQLRRGSDALAKTGLTIVLEPLNTIINHPGMLVSRSDESWLIVKSVNRPNVKFLFDIYHQQITEGNLIRNIQNYFDGIGYFHIGDNPGRQEPGTGEINYRNVFKAIRDLGYTGILGMEHGLSGGDTKAGLEKCFKAYQEADGFV